MHSDKYQAASYISVVIPVYNEEETLLELYRRLSAVLDELCKEEKYEILFVDDGSSDRSFELLRSLHERNSPVRVLRFSRNFGHHIAITAGLDHASGRFVVMMDADLQDQPECIPTLLEKMSQGYDIVYAIREKRQDTLFKRMTSALFWKTIRQLSGIDIPPNQSALRIMSRRYVDALKSIRERSRFLAGIMAWIGFRQIGIPIPHAERFAGKSKYNLWKMMRLTFSAVCAFSYIPLQFATLFGFVVSFFALVYSIILIIEKLLYGLAPGFASLMVGILFMGGIQLITIGVLGEYIGRIFSESQQRPLYFIEDDLNSFIYTSHFAESADRSPDKITNLDRSKNSSLL